MASKKNANEYVTVYYGINIDTFAVESVWLTRGGKLSKGMHTHSIVGSREPLFEIGLVFNLFDCISFPIGMHNEEYAKAQIAALKKTAEERRADAVKIP